MTKLGASVTFGGDQCRINRNKNLLAVGKSQGKMYSLGLPNSDRN